MPEANFFGIVISIQQKSGGNLSEALGNLSRGAARAQEDERQDHGDEHGGEGLGGHHRLRCRSPSCALVYVSSPALHRAAVDDADAARSALAAAAFWMVDRHLRDEEDDQLRHLRSAAGMLRPTSMAEASAIRSFLIMILVAIAPPRPCSRSRMPLVERDVARAAHEGGRDRARPASGPASASGSTSGAEGLAAPAAEGLHEAAWSSSSSSANGWAPKRPSRSSQHGRLPRRPRRVGVPVLPAGAADRLPAVQRCSTCSSSGSLRSAAAHPDRHRALVGAISASSCRRSSSRTRSRSGRPSMRRAWPDALDLLLICVESGMSIEQAFRRVGEEIGASPSARRGARAHDGRTVVSCRSAASPTRISRTRTGP